MNGMKWNNGYGKIGTTLLLYPSCPLKIIFTSYYLEAITKEEYESRVAAMNPFVPSLISKYEKEEVQYDVGDDGCENGVCPVR